MKTPLATNFLLDLSQWNIKEKFQIFKLNENFDFHDNLDFKEKSGVYIFTKREDMPLFQTCTYQFYHLPVYCGMTKNLRARFDQHCNAEKIIEQDANMVAIHYCSTENAADELETKILSEIFFPVNNKKNLHPKHYDVKIPETYPLED